MNRKPSQVLLTLSHIGIVFVSLGLLVFGFAQGDFSVPLFLALLIFLYIGLKGLVDARKQTKD